MKQLIIIFLIIYYSFPVAAQLTTADYDKYWNYRQRLRTYYLHVGSGQGESIPAGIRNFMNWNTGKPSVLHWGDATLYLGWYISVLSTEYYLLQLNDSDIEETLHELCFALMAVERLDSVAEKRWNFAPQTNGFLIRDDIPFNFIELHGHLNYNVDEVEWKNSGAPAKVTEVTSDYLSNQYNAFSQDQIVHLLMGLSFAAHYAPDTLIMFDEVRGDIKNSIAINPAQKAKLLTDKIVEYSANKYGKEPWQLRYPDNTIIPNSRGGDLRANATGIAQVGKAISERNKDFLASLPFNFVWQSQQYIKALRHNISSLHMALVTAAVSDYWRGIRGNNTTEQGINFQGKYPAGKYLWVKYEENNYGWNIFYNYVRIALHNYPAEDYFNSEQIIQSAPYDGPYYHLDNKLPPGGWAASRRFIDNPGRQLTGSIHFPGNYNGLDFMLFFNLFHISDKKSNKKFYVKNFSFHH